MRYPDDVPVLTDGSVTLRALRLEDGPRIVEQCTDPLSIEWTTVPHPYRQADAEQWITEFAPANWMADLDLVWAIEHDGAFAGSVALRPRGNREAEIGFGLHPAARGQGVMRTALGLMLDWAFAERGMVFVHWRANVGNWPSRRVAWAVGFTFGPTIPRLLPHRGVDVDAWTGWIHRDDPRRPTEPWHELPELVTERLRLRPWSDGDGPALVEAATDQRLRHWIPGSPLPSTPADVSSYLTRVRLAAVRGDRFAWCVADRRTDRALGNVAMFDPEGPEGERTAEIGYWTHPSARGRGVMTEAVRAVADWAFGQGGVRRLYVLTAAGNTASRRVVEQAGFTHVGTERAAAPTGDGYDDNTVWDRLRDDTA